MTMRLALSRAAVVKPDASTIEYVVVQSSNGRLRIQTRQGSQLVDTTATAVRPMGAGVYEVDTPEGVYRVTRESGGCGCR